MAKVHNATALTGGTDGCLDYIDVANKPILDGDICFVFTSTYAYIFRANASSGASESSPSVIAPDYSAGVAYTGNLRWLLLATYESNAALAAIAALTPAANKLAYFTSTTAAALADITSAGRALLDDATAAAQVTTLALDNRIFKAWVRFDGTATPATIDQSYNISSLTDGGTGDWTVVIDTDFGGVTYPALAFWDETIGSSQSGAQMTQFNIQAIAAGTFQVNAIDEGAAARDLRFVTIAFFGT